MRCPSECICSSAVSIHCNNCHREPVNQAMRSTYIQMNDKFQLRLFCAITDTLKSSYAYISGLISTRSLTREDISFETMLVLLRTTGWLDSNAPSSWITWIFVRSSLCFLASCYLQTTCKHVDGWIHVQVALRPAIDSSWRTDAGMWTSRRLNVIQVYRYTV